MIKGEYIKKLREEKGISQRQLSISADISHTEISRIETGDRKEPHPIILKAIGKALGINYLDLYYQYGYIDEEVLKGIMLIKEKSKTLNDYTNKELIEELSRRLG